MQIRQLRLVLKAKHFDRTCRFYGEVLGLPRLQSWERDDGRTALFQAGSGALEIVGRSREAERAKGRDEEFDYHGPQHKMAITLDVPSAEKSYEQMLFRDKDVPGGLRKGTDGTTFFETHDPDGVKIFLREGR